MSKEHHIVDLYLVLPTGNYIHAEQSSVKLFFLADTVASIVTSGLQGVIDYILAYMEHFRQWRFCVDSRLHIMTLVLFVCHTTWLSPYERTLGTKTIRPSKIRILWIKIAESKEVLLKDNCKMHMAHLQIDCGFQKLKPSNHMQCPKSIIWLTPIQCYLLEMIFTQWCIQGFGCCLQSLQVESFYGSGMYCFLPFLVPTTILLVLCTCFITLLYLVWKKVWAFCEKFVKRRSIPIWLAQ